MMNADDTDKKRIQSICNQLKLIPKFEIPQMYGYEQHLSCYDDVINIVKLSISNAATAEEYISKLTTSKLRDIRSKIDSGGKIGKKQDMIQGIINKLPNLTTSYNQYIKRTSNEISVNDDNVNIISNENKQKHRVNC